MSSASLTSVTGVRPTSAYVALGLSLLAVTAQVAYVSFQRRAGQPARLERETREAPAYSILDANGLVLARFAPEVELVVSPRSLWQAHTPERIAAAVSEALGGQLAPEEFLEATFPDLTDGAIRVEDWSLTERQALRLKQWIEGVGSERGRLPGIDLEEAPPSPAGARRYSLVWEPRTLLSEQVRLRSSAWRWTRYLADGIAGALLEPEEVRAIEERGDRARSEVRDEIWAHLLPSDFVRISDLRPDRILELRTALAKEGVSSYQISIRYGRKRVYPTGQSKLFGSWGYVGEATEPRPRTGLELLCHDLLERDAWRLQPPLPEVYVWRRDRTVRGQRTHGFVSYLPGGEGAAFESTLDRSLQAFTRHALEGLMAEHRPALAMAIVVDVQSGDVLAVDGIEDEAYEIAPFTPIFHQYTIGSTFKPVTMAIALQEGCIEPDTRLDVGRGAFRIVYPDGRPSGRTIREATGAPRDVITAAECVARSSNAGMAQIGLLVDDATFHGYLERLGYGRPPGCGLGPESSGTLPRLPWSYAYTHASIGFGHNIATTLWQHATVLAGLLRGGVQRPLRLVRAVRQGSERYAPPPPAGERIFDQDVAEEVKDMLRLAAWSGTGTSVRERFEAHLSAWNGGSLPADGWDFGSKTGTAQKVSAETCLHVELAARARWRAEGVRADRERFAALAGLEPPHASCYTSSICVFGRRPGDDREIMVYVVADEPRGPERFGAKVAGPTAERILAEALGLTADGVPPAPEAAPGFALVNRDARGRELAW